eukprot:6198983-Pleurochrysis_carterae.AAC.2
MPATEATLPASHSSQTLEPGVAEKRPAGQGEHAPTPCPPLNALYVPAGQTCAVAFVLPSGQKWPTAHAPSHSPSVKPVPEPYRPAKQSEGTDDPAAAKKPAGAATQPLVVDRLSLLEKVPALQATGVREPFGQAKPGGHVAPAAHAWPAGQGVHCAAFSKPLSLLKVAGGHDRGTELPIGQYPPGGHVKYQSCADWSWYVPAGTDEQTALE